MSIDASVILSPCKLVSSATELERHHDEVVVGWGGGTGGGQISAHCVAAGKLNAAATGKTPPGNSGSNKTKKIVVFIF